MWTSLKCPREFFILKEVQIYHKVVQTLWSSPLCFFFVIFEIGLVRQIEHREKALPSWDAVLWIFSNSCLSFSIRGLVTYMQSSNLGCRNTVYKFKTFLALILLRAQGIDQWVLKTLAAISWQCTVVFNYWQTMSPGTLCAWTTDSSMLFTVYLFPTCD